jgi:hypothetical protein
MAVLFHLRKHQVTMQKKNWGVCIRWIWVRWLKSDLLLRVMTWMDLLQRLELLWHMQMRRAMLEGVMGLLVLFSRIDILERLVRLVLLLGVWGRGGMGVRGVPDGIRVRMEGRLGDRGSIGIRSDWEGGGCGILFVRISFVAGEFSVGSRFVRVLG